MENFSGIGNRTRNLPACSLVPQPTVPPAGVNIEIKCFCVTAVGTEYFESNFTVLRAAE